MERLPRARGEGFAIPTFAGANSSCTEVAFTNGALRQWPDLAGAELVVIPACDYELNILPLARVDEKAGLAQTTEPASRPIGRVKYFDQNVWLENVLGVLDEPGEWVCHAAERKIYLWPRGETPGDGLLAPKLTELLRVEGDLDYEGAKDRSVTGVSFENLTFAHAERYLWHGGTGWSLQHSWEIFDRPTGAVRFRGATHCSVKSCRFTASSGTGLRLDLSCESNVVADCEFSHLGWMAVLLAGYGPGTKDVSQYNVVSNNWIHHTGEIYRAAPAIMVWQSGHNQITHNLIHNTPYSGIAVSGRVSMGIVGQTDGDASRSVRWKEIGQPLRAYDWYEWDYYEQFLHARLNEVAFNEIHHVMESMGDGNGIYISGCGRGNHIFQNFVHDCVGPHMGGGIRCDDFQNQTILEKNVIHHIRGVQVGVSVTGVNHIINNVISDIFPSPRVMGPSKIVHGYICLPQAHPYGGKDHPLDLSGMKIQRNIVFSPRADYLPVLEHKSFSTGPGERLRGTDTGHNLYWCPADPAWGQKYLKQQQTNGWESSSLNADPLFVDFERGDLRLRPESPAWKLGFQAINFSEIGLRTGHPFFAVAKSKSPL
jgi:hypothetical protein